MVGRRYLLDTNALAEPLRPLPHAGFMQWLQSNRAQCCIGSVTWHEALFGAALLAPGKRRQALETYLSSVVARHLPILPYDAEAAAWHALVRAQCQRIGRPLAFADGQIAAIAKIHELAVVTANVRDFDAIEGVEILDWRAWELNKER